MGAARGVAQRASEQATQQQPGAPAAQPAAAAAAAAAGQSQQPPAPAAAPAAAAAAAAAPAAVQASSAPFVQGVHVVVHATPSDLESLPRRLDAFQREVQQLRSDLPIHVVGAGGGAAGGPTGTTWGPPQQPQPQGGQQVNDFVGGVFDGISGIMRGASPIISALGQAAAAGQQQQQQQAAAPAAQPAAGAPAAATGPQPRHLMDKVAMEAARVLQLPEMMGIAMTGNLEPLNKLEPVAVRHLQEALQPEDTPAARRALAAAGGRAAADGVRENAEAMEELLRACGGSEAERDAALAETEKVAAEHAWRLAEAVLAGGGGGAGEATPPPRQFHSVLSETAGRGAGHWAERMRRRFRGGAADVEKVLAAVTKRDVNHAITLLPPGLAPLAAAAAPNAIARVVQWLLRAHREYAAGGAEGEGERRLAADDEACGLPALAEPANDATYGGALSEEDARVLAALAAPAAPPAQPLSENYTSGSR